MNIQKAIEFFGSKSELSRALGITPQALTYWGDEIPHVRQFQIEVLTKGKLKADKLKAS